jgi:hypothetical protein
MTILLAQTIGFWTSFIAGMFILLHIPSCNKHWAYRLKPFSTFLSRYHSFTLNLATLFAIIHIILGLVGLITGVWI